MSCQQLEEGVPQGTSSAALSILGRFGDWRGDATPQMTAFPFCLQYHSLRSLLGRFVGRPKPLQPSPAMRGSETKNGPDVVVGAVARQRRLAMKRFTPSLACFLIVLGQLCLMGEIEINLSVDLSVELSAVLTIAGAVVFANRK